MMKKIEIIEQKGKFYNYTINVMGREAVLLTDKELIELYQNITDIIVNKEELIGE